jgi:serine/threonine protein kinase
MSIKNEKYYEGQVESLKVIRLDENQIKLVKELKKIGVGGFGKVMSGNYLALPVAIKKMKNFSYEEFFREISVVRQFRHPFVPNLYFLYHEGKTLNLVNELINGKTMDDYIKRTKPSNMEIILHLLELATVLNHFHNLNMIHRDLKPSNVMIDQNLDMKLLDFGISKITQNRTFTTTVAMGTILYMAPENFDTSFLSGQTMNEVTKSRITGRVDVWAFGCMMSEIFSKCKPWAPKAKDDTSVLSHLYNKKNFHIPEVIKNIKIRDLIEKCTTVNENMRYNFYMTIKDLRNILVDLILEKKDLLESDHTYLKPKASMFSLKIRIQVIKEDPNNT